MCQVSFRKPAHSAPTREARSAFPDILSSHPHFVNLYHPSQTPSAIIEGALFPTNLTRIRYLLFRIARLIFRIPPYILYFILSIGKSQVPA